jgi:hypothetical protein
VPPRQLPSRPVPYERRRYAFTPPPCESCASSKTDVATLTDFRRRLDTSTTWAGESPNRNTPVRMGCPPPSVPVFASRVRRAHAQP